MGASRRVVALVAAVACTLAACDALLGLDKYQDVTCAIECGTDAAETGPHPDVLEVGPPPDVLEASFDADGGTLVDDAEAGFDVADAQDSSDVLVIGEGGIPVPTGHEVWAHWPMPNPDAAIAPDSSTPLPHPMAYDAGVEGGAPTVYDAVTKLTWMNASVSVTSFAQAWTYCQASPPAGSWRVPTRIELVSLIDYTQPAGKPKADPNAFAFVMAGLHWTSSPVPGPDGGPSAYWAVAFDDGLAYNTGTANYVLCVKGGAP